MKIFFINKNSSRQSPKAIQHEKRVPIRTKPKKSKLARVLKIKVLRRLRRVNM